MRIAPLSAVAESAWRGAMRRIATVGAEHGAADSADSERRTVDGQEYGLASQRSLNSED